jgi:hypothetical protein
MEVYLKKLFVSIAIQILTTLAMVIFIEVGIIEAAQTWVAGLLLTWNSQDVLFLVMTIFQVIIYLALCSGSIASYRDRRESRIVLKSVVYGYGMSLAISLVFVLYYLGSSYFQGIPEVIALTTTMSIQIMNDQYSILIVDSILFISINARLNIKANISK